MDKKLLPGNQQLLPQFGAKVKNQARLLMEMQKEEITLKFSLLDQTNVKQLIMVTYIGK